MSDQILSDWDEQKAQAIQREIIIARHNLHMRDMFSDEGLADLIDRYPRKKLGIFTMGEDPLGSDSFQNGTAEGLSGEQILEAVKKGRLWLNFRAASDELPEYRELRDDMFSELERKTPGLKTFKQDVGVLVSSPNAQVFYHLDVPLVLLWQIRGVKRVWLYEPTEPYVADPDLENVVLRETGEEVPFRIDFDEVARIVDLEPGMMVTWPQFGPHRIVNHDVLNVSLSCEFQTMKSLIWANAVYANGVMRRSFGMNPTIYGNGTPAVFAKAVAARFFKILKLRKSFEYNSPRTFKVDPDAERGICELAQPA